MNWKYEERLDWQVMKKYMASKKVVLFIVEGINDKVSLGRIIKSLYKDYNIFFQITDGDITTNESTTLTNVLEKINDHIKIALKETHYKKCDIIQIVHLVDTDGAFIPEDKIIYENIEKTFYTTQNIKTNFVDNIKKRNNKKSQILNKLHTKKEISKIPYNIYYFSCNLEHVLHNTLNSNKEEKEKLADEFSDKFYLEPEKFIDFINNKSITLSSEYNQSWELIKNQTNSLKRYTNFNLFFKDFKIS